jgi:hypothetical protein
MGMGDSRVRHGNGKHNSTMKYGDMKVQFHRFLTCTVIMNCSITKVMKKNYIPLTSVKTEADCCQGSQYSHCRYCSRKNNLSVHVEGGATLLSSAGNKITIRRVLMLA